MAKHIFISQVMLLLSFKDSNTLGWVYWANA